MRINHPHLWDRADVVRRVIDSLDIAVRTVQAVTRDPHYRTCTPEGGRLPQLSAKVVAESSMLLYATTPVQDDHPRIRENARRLTELLLSPARSEDTLAAMCLDPARARDYATAHIILDHLGHPDCTVERLLEQSIAVGHRLGTERSAFEELESCWLENLRSGGGRDPAADSALKRSNLGRPMDVLGSDRLDRYAFTHAVAYASDFGRRRVALPRPLTDVAADADAALAASLAANDFDQVGELLWTWPMLAIPWTPTAIFAFQTIAAVQDEYGFLPGLSFDGERYRKFPDGERQDYILTTSYHASFVMGFLTAALLRTGTAPPIALPLSDNAYNGTAALLPHAQPQSAEPRWIEALRRLPARQQDSLAPMILVLALRKAQQSGDLAHVRTCLELAIEHDLLDGPAPAQGVALLQRGAALAAISRSRARGTNVALSSRPRR